MILAFDIGNTNTTVCVMKQREVLSEFRLRTDHLKTADEYGMLVLDLLKHNNIDLQALNAAMISSVVPALTPLFRRVAEQYINIPPIVVDTDSDHRLDIRLANPSELGSDRLMAALAANTMYPGNNCIVVDFGTAITVEVITKKGEYNGGIIFPGINLAATALHTATAKLPAVGFMRPDKVVGDGTVKSIQSGLFYGYVSLVDGLLDRVIEEQFSGDDNIVILSTGGLGQVISAEAGHNLEYVPNLVPYGLYLMYERIHVV